MLEILLCLLLLASSANLFPASQNEVVILDDPQYFIEDDTWDEYEGTICDGCPYCWYRYVFLPWMQGEEADP